MINQDEWEWRSPSILSRWYTSIYRDYNPSYPYIWGHHPMTCMWLIILVGFSAEPTMTRVFQLGPPNSIKTKMVNKLWYKNTDARWFKVTFLSPSWRSLNLWKGHFTISKRSQRIARCVLFLHGFYGFLIPKLWWKVEEIHRNWHQHGLKTVVSFEDGCTLFCQAFVTITEWFLYIKRKK